MVRIEKTGRSGQAHWPLQGSPAGTEGEYFAQVLTASFREDPGECLDLDLREVQFMSDRAIETLKRLSQTVRVIDRNGFLRKLLEAEGVGLLH
jgi:anti-anti-sigma regulatory factor